MKKTAVLASILALGALAAEEAPESKAWMTHTEMSFVQTQGNTDTNAFSLDFAGKRTYGKHSLKLDADVLYGTQDRIENKNRVDGEVNYDYSILESLALNAMAGYNDDKFSGFDYHFYAGPGLKYTPIDDKKFHLDLQGNVLYALDQGMDKYYDNNTSDEVVYPYVGGRENTSKVDGTKVEYTSYAIKLNFSWVIVEGFKFVQEGSYRGDFEQDKRYFVYSKSALESKINDIFSMGVSYKVDYTNLQPAGNERADRTFMTSLIIDY